MEKKERAPTITPRASKETLEKMVSSDESTISVGIEESEMEGMKKTSEIPMSY